MTSLPVGSHICKETAQDGLNEIQWQHALRGVQSCLLDGREGRGRGREGRGANFIWISVVLLTTLETFFHGTSSVQKLALLFARKGYSSRLVDAFARFSPRVQCLRKVWFRRLSSDDKKGELAAKTAALDVPLTSWFFSIFVPLQIIGYYW